ncbi:roadblock/LC7 domain-containing protein [Candidatus Methylacidithermus pantelleriae]|uniref:Roadblock/LC7 family protein n=1 Tax=Candidatus Methylacidithermus pantelleriae TaxID=2744239 RepID=A0A8J2BMK3_9BACT|nr:roadblock/LC7 domain-containing protein [Candidatus Methylacidithermus pantelleriae]CAF0692891.1 Roadblock/LC7 family protein [Candidatus Methylacidithermus pantelleriae]
MALADELNEILNEIRSALPEVTGAIVATSDGLSIAHSLSGGDPTRVAAMVATALGLGKRICDTLGGGQFSEASVVGTGTQIFVYAAGTKGVLSLMARPGGNVGLIHLIARDAAQKIATLLQ